MSETTGRDQVTEVVHGFVQVWSKFESLLPEEIVEIRSQFGPTGTASEPNYQVLYRVSTALPRSGSLTMSELSSALMVPMSTTTRMVDWLVKQGLVVRMPDPEDRRVVRVAFTDAGRELSGKIEDHVRERVQEILGSLTPEERRTLLALIKKIVASLNERALIKTKV
jgi:DNA-binding MarR family transcriptional regulator